jgi:hypothetical protein
MVVLGALNIVGSLGQDSKRVQHTYSGVRVVDLHVSNESVEVREGVGDSTRLDRSITWSLRTPTHGAAPGRRPAGDHVALPVLDGPRLLGPRAARRAAGHRGARPQLGRLGAGHRVDRSRRPVVQRRVGVRDRAPVDRRHGIVVGRVHEARLRSAPRRRWTRPSSAGSVEVVVPRGSDAYLVDAGSSAGSSTVAVRTDPASDRTIRAHSSAGSVQVHYPPR